MYRSKYTIVILTKLYISTINRGTVPYIVHAFFDGRGINNSIYEVVTPLPLFCNLTKVGRYTCNLLLNSKKKRSK
jgi:hypothetical protein